jgi:hypothetical protein
MQIDTVSFLCLSFNTRQTSMFIIHEVIFHLTLLTSDFKIPNNNHTFSRKFNNIGINPSCMVECLPASHCCCQVIYSSAPHILN